MNFNPYFKKIKRNENKLEKTIENTIISKTIKISDSFCCLESPCNYSFSVFQSINDIFYLIYSTIYNSIIIYDLIHNKKINKIKNAHSSGIKYFRHFLDAINKRDLILTISSEQNNNNNNNQDYYIIKIWNINNLECIYNLDKILNLYSACILNDINNQLNIILDCQKEKLKVFDLKGNIIKKINIENKSKLSIEYFYDNNFNKNYIIIGNDKVDNISSYDYNEDKIYHIYDNYDDSINSINIIKEKDKVLLIYSTKYFRIVIWNFHTAELIKSMSFYSKNDLLTNCICYWDSQYMFIGYNKKKFCFYYEEEYYLIKLIDIKKKELSKKEFIINDLLKTLRKINHPQKGNYLISQEDNGEIIIFENILINEYK